MYATLGEVLSVSSCNRIVGIFAYPLEYVEHNIFEEM
jgi:hypothetical protein